MLSKKICDTVQANSSVSHASISCLSMHSAEEEEEEEEELREDEGRAATRRRSGRASRVDADVMRHPSLATAEATSVDRGRSSVAKQSPGRGLAVDNVGGSFSISVFVCFDLFCFCLFFLGGLFFSASFSGLFFLAASVFSCCRWRGVFRSANESHRGDATFGLRHQRFPASKGLRFRRTKPGGQRHFLCEWMGKEKERREKKRKVQKQERMEEKKKGK